MEDRVGSFLGNYRLVRILGKGGFAVVYLGEHIHLGTLAAIKLLTAKLSEEEKEHFREEARTIARLRHPHIVRVLEFGIQDDLPYLVMDYAPNGTMRQRFQKGRQIDPLTIVPYVQQIASALQFAHDHRLVHRDVKPENMLLDENGAILLSDFGIAVVAQSSRHQDVQEVVGTLAYMAPEQIQAHPRPASDQYSLGVVIYEWLTGTRPFTGSMSEILAKQISTPPPPIRDKIPNVPAEVEQVVLTALAKDPKDRFASIRAFLKAFEQASVASSSSASPTPGASPVNAWTPGQAGNVISSPSIPSGSTASSPQGTPSTPSGAAASSPSMGTGAAASASPEHPTPHVTPSGVPPTPPAAAEPPLPSGPRQVPPASEAADIFSAPTMMGSFLVPTPPAEVGPAISPVAPAPGERQAPQPVTVLPPGWLVSQPETPSGSIQSGPTLLASGPIQTGPTLFSGPPGAPPQPGIALAPSPSLPPSSQGVSRRKVLVGGIAGLVGLAALGSGATWLILSRSSGSAQTQTPTTPTPTATPLPTGAVYIYPGHSKAVWNLAWAPDGKRIVSVSQDQTAQVWDAATGTHVLKYTQHVGDVRAVAWSPNGQQIVSGGQDHTAQVWDASTGTRSILYTGHKNSVLAAAWSPDGKYIVSGGADHFAHVWNAATGALLFTYKGHNGYVQALAWSRDGKRIASGSGDHTIHIWDALTGKNVVKYKGHTDLVNGLAWSPDGKQIASASSDHTVQVWDAITLEPIITYRGHTNEVNSVAWSPDGKQVASGSSDKTVQVWNISNSTAVFTYRGHKLPVSFGLAWTPKENLVASTGVDKTVQVWRPQ